MWATRRKVKKVLVKAINATIAPLDRHYFLLLPFLFVMQNKAQSEFTWTSRREE